MPEADATNPIAEMLAIDDEAERGRALPEAEVTTDPPADKAERERDETGKFKGKDEPKGDEKPDDKAKDAPKADDKPKAPDTVPLAKYMEEKRALRAELEARDLTIKQINDRLAAFEKANAPKPPDAPDFVENPKEYVDHKVSEALAKIEEANKAAAESGKKAEAVATEQQQREQLQQVMSTVQAVEREFVAQNPDYYDALAHIREIRVFQIREFKPDVTDAEIRHIITHEETNLAAQLLAAGKNPSATAYALAQKYGYQKKAPPAADPPANVAKLPDPPAKTRLPPDQTLGSGSAPGSDEVYKPGERDPVDDALASLFKKRA